MSVDDTEDERFKCLLMLFEENRVKTFVDWPFSGDDCPCTPEKVGLADVW